MMLRLIISIVAGLVIGSILSTSTDQLLSNFGVFPDYKQDFRLSNGLALLALSYRSIYSILAAYITAMIAREQYMKAAWILGSTGTLIWLSGAIIMWEYAPAWYNVAGVLTALPFALAGASLYKKRR